MRPSEALAKHRNAIVEILGRYPVSNPRVFGSVARGEDTEESDLDIIVQLPAAYKMRNRLVHGYDDVLVSVVVDTGRWDIPPFKVLIEAILTDAGEDLS